MLRKVTESIVNDRWSIVKDVLLCLISAALLIISFPKFNIELASWFGFVPLFFALKNKTKLQSFILSYLTGFVFWCGIIYWLCHVTTLGTLILILYLSLYFGFFGLFFSSAYLLPTIYYLLFLPSVWVVLEYLRSYLLTGFPWALMGYSQYLNLEFIQVADLTGVGGVSFLLILVNTAIYSILQPLKSENKIKVIIIVTLSILLVYSYGIWRMPQYYEIKSKEMIRVSVIQGNIPQELKWDESARNLIIGKYLALSRLAAVDKSQLIIWPEASLPVIPQEEIAYFDLVKVFAKEAQVPLLIGAVTSQGDSYYNSALLISKKGENSKQYDKVHLVPFGEYIPLRKILPFLQVVVPIGDISQGKEFMVFDLKGKNPGSDFKFSTLICFEDLFPNLSRKFVKKGADFLVNITNDAWYKKTSAAAQHLQASVFRAVENRVFLARAANTGISAFITPRGELISKIANKEGEDIFVEGMLSENIPIIKPKLTFYTRFGDVFMLLCFSLAVFLKVKNKNV